MASIEIKNLIMTEMNLFKIGKTVTNPIIFQNNDLLNYKQILTSQFTFLINSYSQMTDIQSAINITNVIISSQLSQTAFLTEYQYFIDMINKL
jgi:hypothetical protein